MTILTNHKVCVSVIIPAFNAAPRLLLLLESLERQSCKAFEVIVVDDGSTDETRQRILQRIGSYPISLRYYYLDNTEIFGAGIARNYGAKQALGDVLLFLDQDCVAREDLIQNHIHSHTSKDIILGYFAGYGHDTKCYDFSKLKDYIRRRETIPVLPEFRDRLFLRETVDDIWHYFVSAHFSIKKKIFKEFNFDEALIQWGGQDVDLGYRLFKKGCPVYFEKNCLVYNSSREPMIVKRKALELLTSAVYMYQKHHTDEMKWYYLERFYYVPLKYRGSWQLVVQDDSFEARQCQTYISIDRNRNAHIVLGFDFVSLERTIQEISPLVSRVSFSLHPLGRRRMRRDKALKSSFRRIWETFKSSEQHHVFY